MRYIRSQVILTLVGLALTGMVLYTQSRGIEVTLVPARGGTYIEAVVGHPATLNPLLMGNNPANRDLGRLLHAGLMRFDAQGLPVPDLAESWAVTAAGRAYTFVIRSGLRWSDGEPIDADDVIYTISLMQDPAFTGPEDIKTLWQSIVAVKLNDTSLKLELPDAFAPFIDYMTFGIVPEHRLPGVTAAELAAHPYNLNPVGAGPFVLDGLVVDDGQITEVALTPNRFYYGYSGDQPFLSQLRLRYFDDAQDAMRAYEQGEVLGIAGLPPELIPDMLDRPDVNLYSARASEYDLIFMNQGNEEVNFFQDKKVRQALLAGMNRQWMLDNLLNGQGIVATGPILPDSWAYNDNLLPVTYDPRRAVQLLEDAGYRYPDTALPGTPDYVRQKDGKALAFTLIVPDTPYYAALTEVIVQNWAGLGIDVTVRAVAPQQLQRRYLETRNFEALLINYSFAGFPDPDPYPLWHQTEIETGQNYSGFDNRGMSELMEQARVFPSITERTRLYKAFQSRFTDEPPALLLWYPVYTYAVDNRVRGVRLGPINGPPDRFNTVADWYIVTRRVIVNE